MGIKGRTLNYCVERTGFVSDFALFIAAEYSDSIDF